MPAKPRTTRTRAWIFMLGDLGSRKRNLPAPIRKVSRDTLHERSTSRAPSGRPGPRGARTTMHHDEHDDRSGQDREWTIPTGRATAPPMPTNSNRRPSPTRTPSISIPRRRALDTGPPAGPSRPCRRAADPDRRGGRSRGDDRFHPGLGSESMPLRRTTRSIVAPCCVPATRRRRRRRGADAGHRHAGRLVVLLPAGRWAILMPRSRGARRTPGGLVSRRCCGTWWRRASC